MRETRHDLLILSFPFGRLVQQVKMVQSLGAHATPTKIHRSRTNTTAKTSVRDEPVKKHTHTTTR